MSVAPIFSSVIFCSCNMLQCHFWERSCLFVCFVKVKVNKLYWVSDKTCLNLDMMFTVSSPAVMNQVQVTMNNMTQHTNYSLFLLKDPWDHQMPVPPAIVDWLCKLVRKLLTNTHQALCLMLMLIFYILHLISFFSCSYSWSDQTFLYLLCCLELGELCAALHNHLYARMKHLKLYYYRYAG